VESSFDDSDDKKASVFNKYGIFWKDGHYQWKVVTNTGRGRTVYEDTYEEDVETRYAWLYVSDLASILQKGEIIHVPVLSGEKKGSSIDVGYVCFNMKNDCGKSVKVWGIFYEGEFIYYDNNRDSLKGELIIPSNVRGLEVKSVRGFCDCEGITRLVLSEGIGSINEGAFVDCKNIQEIVFPKTIHRIYPGAFERCNAIKRLVIPEEARYVRYGLSWYHSFKHVIGNLDEIARYDGDTQVEHDLYLDNGEYLDFVCTKSISGSYAIHKGTVTIGNGAFCDCKGLTGIIMPATVKIIGKNAFSGCSNLKHIAFDENSILGQIEDCAFFACGLTSIHLPDTVYLIGSKAFCHCGLTSIHLPERLLGFSDGFSFCEKLEQITIPPKVEGVWPKAFCGCSNLESVVFHEDSKLRSIEEEAFKDCIKLKDINIPPTVYSIGNCAFEDCKSLTSISLPNIYWLSRAMFKGCSQLEEINIPLTVKEVLEESFSGCSSLRKVTMPDVKVASDAFRGCQSLEELQLWEHYSYKRVLPESVFPKDMQPFADTPFGRNLERIREMKKKEAEDRLKQEK